jgi:uncharacterized protein (DUF2147 family)
MMRRLILLACLIASPALAQEQSPIGSWLTEDNGGVVTLRHCGAMICGSVEGVTEFQPNGAPPVDYQGRSRCHLTIINDLHLDEPGVWAGHITNPDDGNVYSIHISIDAQGKMRMRGYIGIPLLGRTTIWTRFQGHVTPDCHIERN